MDKKNPAICAMAAVLVALSAFSAYAQECTPGLILDTDSVAYLQGDQVTVSGTLLELNCSPVGIPTGIGVTVLLPSGSPFYARQLGTNDLGEFGFTFTLPSDAALGEWSIVAAYGSAFDYHAFTVSGGDCLEGDTRQCGQTDTGLCTFGTETCTAGEWTGCTAVFPAAEVCDDGEDNDCDGSVDEGCSSGDGGGGGGTCLPKWSCTEWGECQSDDTQTRTCERVIPGCGTSTVPPEETQDCEYTGGSAEEETCQEFWTCTEWSECVDGTQSRTCSDENSCGTEESMPSDTQACQLAETAGSEGGLPTGLVIGDIVGSYLWLFVVLLLIGAGAFLKFRK